MWLQCSFLDAFLTVSEPQRLSVVKYQCYKVKHMSSMSVLCNGFRAVCFRKLLIKPECSFSCKTFLQIPYFSPALKVVVQEWHESTGSHLLISCWTVTGCFWLPCAKQKPHSFPEECYVGWRWLNALCESDFNSSTPPDLPLCPSIQMHAVWLTLVVTHTALFEILVKISKFPKKLNKLDWLSAIWGKNQARSWTSSLYSEYTVYCMWYSHYSLI